MGRIGLFMSKAYNKTKDAIKDEIKNKRELRKNIELMSDKELKHLAITKGEPYESAWLNRRKAEKRLKEKFKEI